MWLAHQYLSARDCHYNDDGASRMLISDTDRNVPIPIPIPIPIFIPIQNTDFLKEINIIITILL